MAPTHTQSSSAGTPSKATDKMESQYWKTFKMLLPKLPLIVRVAVTHVLSLSESSKYLDLRSDLIVSVLRSLLEPSGAPPRSVSAVQMQTLRDPGIKGRIWVSTYATSPPPETDLRDSLMSAMRNLQDPGLPEPNWRAPEFAPVEAEWTGYRAGVSTSAPPPQVSNAELYKSMMAECTKPTTVLYLHGGAYYLLDPASHRPTTKKLAKLTGGRCYSVRYRLAPQHPFPSALLDALVAYFTLLYPPPDAYHEPVQPENIVISGDSAGGNLTLSLTLLLIELRRKGTPILWHGEQRQVPLPAGVALNSPWLDITQSFPSWESPAPFDYLPKTTGGSERVIKECTIWPAKPPRKRLYVEDDLAAHPLVSLVMNSRWQDMPPVYMCTGWEILALEDRYLAKQLAAQGVPLVFEEYEAMPHCFAMILTTTPNARRCFDGWARFIRAAVDDPANIKSSATTIRARSLEEVPCQFEKLSDLTEEDIRARLLAKAELQLVREGNPAKL